MQYEEAREALLSALVEIQTGSGRPVPEITDNTCPLKDFEGFDSYNAVEISFLLSDNLGCEIPSDLILCSDYRQPLRIHEIVSRLYEYINDQKGAMHAQFKF
jgi:acyl carrier protein